MFTRTCPGESASPANTQARATEAAASASARSRAAGFTAAEIAGKPVQRDRRDGQPAARGTAPVVPRGCLAPGGQSSVKPSLPAGRPVDAEVLQRAAGPADRRERREAGARTRPPTTTGRRARPLPYRDRGTRRGERARSRTRPRRCTGSRRSAAAPRPGEAGPAAVSGRRRRQDAGARTGFPAMADHHARAASSGRRGQWQGPASQRAGGARRYQGRTSRRPEGETADSALAAAAAGSRPSRPGASGVPPRGVMRTQPPADRSARPAGPAAVPRHGSRAGAQVGDGASSAQRHATRVEEWPIRATRLSSPSSASRCWSLGSAAGQMNQTVDSSGMTVG